MILLVNNKNTTSGLSKMPVGSLVGTAHMDIDIIKKNGARKINSSCYNLIKIACTCYVSVTVTVASNHLQGIQTVFAY